jgi:hypothetical protein
MKGRPKTRTAWPARPIRPVLDAARDEAQAARHGYVGLEHLLLALTRPEAPATAALLAAHGVAGRQAHDAVAFVVGSGRGDGPRLGPAALLATLGIDLEEIRRHVRAQFGPNAIHDLYTGPVGWNLRPAGPLCDVGLSPHLKRVLHQTLGRCWDSAPPRLHERLLLHALDSDSEGLAGVLDTLGVDIPRLRAAITTQLQIAS